MSSRLTFDRASHTYGLDGVVVPSVTQVLQGVGLLDYSFLPADVRDEAKLRGRWVADLVALYLNRDRKLPDSLFKRLQTSQAEWMGYFDAYRRFEDEVDFLPLLVERPLYNAIYGYAGTLDLTGIFKDQLVLPDIKTGEAPDAVWAQTSGYHAGLDSLLDYEFRTQRHSRAVIELHKDGSYRFEVRKARHDPEDRALFFSALTVYRNLPQHVKEARRG